MLVKQSAVSHSSSILLWTGIKWRVCMWDVRTYLDLVYLHSLKIWPSYLAPEGQGEFSGRWFPYDKMLTGLSHSWWLYTHSISSSLPLFWLTHTHTPLPAVNTTWKKIFTFASMSERKLKLRYNDSCEMCKTWYESLPRSHIRTCTQACSVSHTHSRVYIYKRVVHSQKWTVTLSEIRTMQCAITHMLFSSMENSF